MILIQEDFLHYLWKYKYFTTSKLQTTNNESIKIYHSGNHNLDSGPDFFNAKIRIGNQIWAGNVEIHVKSSDWYVHQHEKDENYDNVILHVVWEKDLEIYNKNNIPIPTLEIHSLVSKDLLKQYKALFLKKTNWIQCEKLIDSIDAFTLNNWIEVLFFERLQQKTELVFQLLEESKNDWESVLFKLLAKNFGLKINGDAFLNLANSIDFRIIRKEQNKLINLEALFFGQSGFLDKEFESIYFKELKKEYRYLQSKYNLEPIFNGQFKFFRLRPNNFPTIRIAQLSMLYFTHQNLFSKIINCNNLDEIYSLFDTKTSSFWENHYNFSSVSKRHSKGLTKSFIDLVVINTIIPLKFIYSKHIGKLNEVPIINLAKQTKSEKNSIISKFEDILKKNNNTKYRINNAFESQAYLQLKTSYCNKKLCLQCAIGNTILKNRKEKILEN